MNANCRDANFYFRLDNHTFKDKYPFYLKNIILLNKIYSFKKFDTLNVYIFY